MKKVWILCAVVDNVCVPLCYSWDESDILEELEGATLLYELYQKNLLWLDETEFSEEEIAKFVSCDDYFNMYNAPVD